MALTEEGRTTTDRLNNVDVRAVEAFAAQVAEDENAGRKLERVTGRWVFAEGKPQFTAELDYPCGTQTTETDFAQFMGGGGLKPETP